MDEIVPKRMQNIPNNPVNYELELIRNAADYMKYTLEDISFAAAGRIAQLIVAEYPAVFAFRSWTDDTHVHCDGVKQLKTRIYDRARRIEDPDKKRKRREQTDNNSDNIIEESTSKRFHKNQDTYGCVCYEPSLPEGETNETQLKHKITLLESLTDAPEKKLQIAEEIRLVALTYAFQRISLNRRNEPRSNNSTDETTLKNILTADWPQLTHTKHFLNYASILIGRDIPLEWENNIGVKLPVIFEYFTDYSRKYRKLKNIPQAAISLHSTLAEIKETSKQINSNTPYTLGFVLLIGCYFQEEDLFELVVSINV